MVAFKGYTEQEIEQIAKEKLIHYNTSNEPFVVIDEYRKNGRAYNTIEFLNTKTVKEVTKDAVKERWAKDPYAPNICGVACQGLQGTRSPEGARKVYQLWLNMIYRCYNENDKSYKFYGAKGVTVSDRWLCYEYFYKDLPLVEGYDKEQYYQGLLELDKDTKFQGNKVYSLETCRFISKDDNRKAAVRQEFLPHLATTKCLALDKDGNEYCVINIPMFAKAHGLDKSKIYGIMSGNIEKKSTKGWWFQKVTNFDEVNVFDKSIQKRKKSKGKYKFFVDYNGEIKEFGSATELASFISASPSSITKHMKDNQSVVKGFKVWRELNND